MSKKPKPDFSQEDLVNALADLMSERQPEDGYLVSEIYDLCKKTGISMSMKRLDDSLRELKEQGRVKSVKAIRYNIHDQAVTRDVLKFVGQEERD